MTDRPDYLKAKTDVPQTLADPQELPEFPTRGLAAEFWLHFGLRPIPIVPGLKRPAVKYGGWLDSLTQEQIRAHWRAHPSHDVGCVLTDRLLVLDADADEAVQALFSIEKAHNAVPAMIVETRRGCHHFFALEPGTHSTPDSHGPLHPDRIDVRTAGNSHVLPPSGPRRLICLNARNIDELSVVDQAFVDAIFVHNGRSVPRPPRTTDGQAPSVDLNALGRLLHCLDPDIGYQDWVRALMAVFHASQGSDEGFALADGWCSGGVKYRGTRDVMAKWRSFSLGRANPVTIRSLVKLVADGGTDPAEALTEPFEACEFEILS